MFEQLKEMNAELETLKKAHLEKSKVLFTDVTKKVFEANPKLESFSWTQYTPYFNDGDECTFSANTSYPKINGSNKDGGVDYFNEVTVIDYGTYNRDTKKYEGRVEEPNENYSPELVKAKKTVEEFLENIDESVLRDLFGDHVEVTVTREGTEVDDYDHD